MNTLWRVGALVALLCSGFAACWAAYPVGTTATLYANNETSLTVGIGTRNVTVTWKAVLTGAQMHMAPLSLQRKKGANGTWTEIANWTPSCAGVAQEDKQELTGFIPDDDPETTIVYYYKVVGQIENPPGGSFESSPIVAVTVVPVEIESISGLDAVYCTHEGCQTAVTAHLAGGIALPAGYMVTWGGDATFTNQIGLNAIAHFAGHAGKNKKITATLGGTHPIVYSSEYTVVTSGTVQGVVEVDYVIIPIEEIPEGNPGMTDAQLPIVDITAYFTHPTHKWQCKVTTSEDIILQGASLAGTGVSEATVEQATTEAIYRKMYADLDSLGHDDGLDWYMVSAVLAHETVHSDDWMAVNNPLFDVCRATVEGLSVDYDDETCDNATAAYNQIKDLQAYIDAIIKYINDGEDAKDDIDHPHCDTRTDAAERAVVDPMLDALDAKAAAQNPPWTR